MAWLDTFNPLAGASIIKAGKGGVRNCGRRARSRGRRGLASAWSRARQTCWGQLTRKPDGGTLISPLAQLQFTRPRQRT